MFWFIFFWRTSQVPLLVSIGSLLRKECFSKLTSALKNFVVQKLFEIWAKVLRCKWVCPHRDILYLCADFFVVVTIESGSEKCTTISVLGVEVNILDRHSAAQPHSPNRRRIWPRMAGLPWLRNAFWTPWNYSWSKHCLAVENLVHSQTGDIGRGS